MSYVSVLKTIPEFLSQPTGIAVLASVGIHGAIAFLLPLMPMESNKAKDTTQSQSVGLLELNQADQNRLPQTSTPQATQPQASLQSQLPKQPQLPLPNFATQQTPLPPQPPAVVAPSSPSGVEPPLSSSINLSPNGLNIVSLPKNQYVRIPQTRDLQFKPYVNKNENIPPSIPPQNYPEVPNISDKVALGESKPLSPAIDESNNEPTPQAPISEINNQSKPNSASNLPELEAGKIPPDLTSNPTPAVISPDTTTTATATGTTSLPTSQTTQADAVSKTPQVEGKLALSGPSLQQWQQQQSRLQTTGTQTPSKLPSQARQNPLIAKTTTFGEQFLRVKKQYPNIETKQHISETINAKKGQEGRVEGGLVIDREGKVESINFLDSSVSSELKTSTREYFREYFQKNPVQANGKPKYYPFSLAFSSNGSNVQPNSSNNLQAAPKLPPLNVNNKTQQLQINRTQPSSNEDKDLIERLKSPQENSQSSQPVQELNNSKPASVTPATVKPVSNQIQRNTQPASVKPASVKPISTESQQNNQPASVTPANVKSEESKTQSTSRNKPVSFDESGKQLIQKLRQSQEERESSNQEK